MGIPSQRKLEKKRRKAKKEERRRQPHIDLAYTGRKYRTNELVPIHVATETGIYECSVMTQREMTDNHVRAALDTLILALRRGELPPLEDSGEEADMAMGVENLIIWNIRHHWRRLFASQPHPGRDNLIGVLRTTLASIDVWGSRSPESRGYLRYIEGFLGRLGISVRECSESEAMEFIGANGTRIAERTLPDDRARL